MISLQTKEKVERYLKRQFQGKQIWQVKGLTKSNPSNEMYGIDSIKILVQETDKSIYYSVLTNRSK